MAGKTLYEQFYYTVMNIPKGKVATYGQIAAYSGNKNYARLVGNAMHDNPSQELIPCHRVVNSFGRLSPCFAFGGLDGQKKLLEAEGVEVSEEYCVDLEKYQWVV